MRRTFSPLRALNLALFIAPSAIGAQQPVKPINWDQLRDETVGVLADYLRIDATNPLGGFGVHYRYDVLRYAQGSVPRITP